MNCSRELIGAYLDEELDPGLRNAVEEHLASCAPCAETHRRLRRLQANVRSAAPRFTAPASLERSVRAGLRAAASAGIQPRAKGLAWRPIAIAASILLVISVAWSVRRPQPGIAEGELLAQNIVSDHIRSLMGNHLLDVPSSDRHSVKPWFNGKLDFSPDVKDLSAEGFPLIGGRLDYVADRPVAVLVFQRRQHIINLFTSPAEASGAGEVRFSRHGYNVIHWTRGAMTWWAVSDLNAPELQQFKDLYNR